MPTVKVMTLMIREARADEIADIVRLLSDDPLGALREDCSSPLPDAYRDSFAEINADSNNELVVALQNDNIVGVLQLTTDKSRPEALSFYEQLGFVSSHHGMKLKLEAEK